MGDEVGGGSGGGMTCKGGQILNMVAASRSIADLSLLLLLLLLWWVWAVR